MRRELVFVRYSRVFVRFLVFSVPYWVVERYSDKVALAGGGWGVDRGRKILKNRKKQLLNGTDRSGVHRKCVGK